MTTEGVLLGGKFQKITEWYIALLLCYTVSKTSGFWRQNTNCSTKTQPQTHRCLSMFKFFKEIRKVFHNSTGNSQGSILHEYFNWQDPLRILNFLRLRQAQQFLEGYSAKYYPLILHLTIVWIKTFQSYYNLQMEGQTVAATPKIYDWWPHYFKK